MKNVAFAVLWDGVFNVSSPHRILSPSIDSRGYDCTRRWKLEHSKASKAEFASFSGLESVKNSGCILPLRQQIIAFLPYEEILALSLPLPEGRIVHHVVITVYAADFESNKINNGLVYQEYISSNEILFSDQIGWGTLTESKEEFQKRTSLYYGREDFAHLTQGKYIAEIRVHYDSGLNLLNPDFYEFHIQANDFLSAQYNPEKNLKISSYISDFSRIQRLLRNKGVFFEHLQHIEDFLTTHPGSTLLQALEHFEDLVYFPTVQAVAVGLLPSDIYSELIACAYAFHDIGVRSCHGSLTHRLQWHAIIRLLTEEHTIPIASGFHYSPLELYSIARGSLFHGEAKAHERSQVGECKIDLWRFLFDRFDKHAIEGGVRSDLLLEYPEKYNNEMHYAEQAHMAMLNLPPDPSKALKIVDQFADELIFANNFSKRKREDVWIERYLKGISDPTLHAHEARLSWGCLLTHDEWLLMNERLDSIGLKENNFSSLPTLLRSYFVEAVLAVRVVKRIFEDPKLLPPKHPLHEELSRNFGSMPLWNMYEEVAPQLRISMLLAKKDEEGLPLFKPMQDSRGNSSRCLMPANASPLRGEDVEYLQKLSRIKLREQRSIPTENQGVAFS